MQLRCDSQNADRQTSKLLIGDVLLLLFVLQTPGDDIQMSHDLLHHGMPLLDASIYASDTTTTPVQRPSCPPSPRRAPSPAFRTNSYNHSESPLSLISVNDGLSKILEAQSGTSEEGIRDVAECDGCRSGHTQELGRVQVSVWS